MSWTSYPALEDPASFPTCRLGVVVLSICGIWWHRWHLSLSTEANEMTWSQDCVGFAFVGPAPSKVPGTQWVPNKGLLNGGVVDLLLVNPSGTSCSFSHPKQKCPGQPWPSALFAFILLQLWPWLVPIKTSSSRSIFNLWLSPSLQVLIHPLPHL